MAEVVRRAAHTKKVGADAASGRIAGKVGKAGNDPEARPTAVPETALHQRMLRRAMHRQTRLRRTEPRRTVPNL